VREAIDDFAHLAADPLEHGVQQDLWRFSPFSAHTNLLVSS
jgi:hypothetical protein